MIHCNEVWQVQMYGPRGIWCDLLGCTAASMRFLIYSPFKIFSFYFLPFLSPEFCFIHGGSIKGQRADAKGLGMNGIKSHDVKQNRIKILKKKKRQRLLHSNKGKLGNFSVIWGCSQVLLDPDSDVIFTVMHRFTSC